MSMMLEWICRAEDEAGEWRSNPKGRIAAESRRHSDPPSSGEGREYGLVLPEALVPWLAQAVPGARPLSGHFVLTLAEDDYRPISAPGEIRQLTPADRTLTDEFPAGQPTLTELVEWATSGELLRQGLQPVYDVDEDNVASIRTATAVGYRKVLHRLSYRLRLD